MHHRLAVVRRNLDGRVRLAGGRAADEQRELEAQPFHLAGDVLHLVERRRDEAAQADEVGLLLNRAVENLLTGHHHAHVDHLVVVTGEHDADDVLANVVDVALHGREHDLALGLHGFTTRGHCRLLGFHERREVGHGLLHHAGGLHHLRQEHLARAEQVTDDAHAGHERPLDDQQRLAQLGARFLGVGVNVEVNALHERVRESFLDRALAPLFLDLLVACGCACAGGFELLAEVHQALGRVGAAVEQRVFYQLLQLGLDLFIHFEHAGVDDAHVHSGLDSMEEERAVHRLAHRVVAAEAERNVRDAAADLGVREVLFDPTRGFDEVHGVVVVLLDARRDGEDVRIENDVLGREANFIDEDAVGAFADADLLSECCRLAILIERHHHDGGAILEHLARVFAEQVLAAFERDGVHDALALKAFQAGLDDFPLGGVHHEGSLRDLRFAAKQLEEARHGCDAINHPFVHADVDDVGPVLDLLAGDGDGLVVFPFLDQLRELRRTGDVRALANHHELADLLCERLRAGETQRLGCNGGCARRNATEPFGAGFLGREVARMPAFECLRDGSDVLGCVAAAAAGDVDESALRKLAEETAHVLRLQIEAGCRKRIGQTSVRIAGDGGVGLRREFGEKRPHQVRAERTVQADRQRLHVFHRVPIRLNGLRRDHRLATASDGGRNRDRKNDLIRVEHFLDRHESRLGVERIEDGLHQQEVRAACNQCADLLDVGRLHLVERANAEARIVRIR